ncbi:hypothetical protein SRS16CHR_02996 [Variovorax sp. SRS16]|nr:hypothetical protein [Variovorax sp. SRS16]VTU22173.1 hypothetical protein SRS16CHR_02996 [Variovorax sp. SRS16]
MTVEASRGGAADAAYETALSRMADAAVKVHRDPVGFQAGH